MGRKTRLKPPGPAQQARVLKFSGRVAAEIRGRESPAVCGPGGFRRLKKRTRRFAGRPPCLSFRERKEAERFFHFRFQVALYGRSEAIAAGRETEALPRGLRMIGLLVILEPRASRVSSMALAQFAAIVESRATAAERRPEAAMPRQAGGQFSSRRAPGKHS